MTCLPVHSIGDKHCLLKHTSGAYTEGVIIEILGLVMVQP